ncbi:sodium:solute symporter family protein [Lysinibacillus fusiformis]|nr:sodium:solute symporter family protein [Lysinibacillus fusiformis]
MSISLIVLILYLLLCIGIGVYANKLQKQGTTNDYLTGGKDVSAFVNGVAIFAAFATGGTMLGNMGLSYAGGWGYITAYNAGVACGYLFTAFFLAKVLRNMNVSTVPEFIRVRFNNKALNIIVPLILIGTLTAYLVAQMKVGGLLGERLFHIPYGWSVVLIGLVYIFYTAYGGMKAVTLTDFIQGLLMIAVVIVVGAIAITKGGGVGDLYSVAQEIKPEWTKTDGFPYIAYIGGFLVWMTVNAVLPHTVMRIFSAKTEKAGRVSLTIGIFMYVVTAIITCIFVVAMTIILNQGQALSDNDAAFLLFLDQAVPEFIKALAYAGIFAAVMSSVSAMLLALGAALAYDLIGTIKPDFPEEKKRKFVPIAIVGFGILTLLLSLNPPALLTLLYSAAMGLLASGLFFPVVLGIWWKRMNSIGALVGTVLGSVSYLVLLWGFELPSLSQICYSLPISFLGCVIGSLVSAPPTEKDLHRVTIAHEREYLESDQI